MGIQKMNGERYILTFILHILKSSLCVLEMIDFLVVILIFFIGVAAETEIILIGFELE